MRFNCFAKFDGRRLRRAAARAIAPCLLACLLCGAAAAYTLVMRGGRRVEIPDAFSLTRAALTYETAPGVSVTVQLDHVDIEATERANGEPAGSFLRRAREAAVRDAAARATPGEVSRRGAIRTVTNRELEAARRARVESERDYERRRGELGLPSAEEMRRRDEREAEFMREMALRRAEEEAAERYWRALSAGPTHAFGTDAGDVYVRAPPAGLFEDYTSYYSLGLFGVAAPRGHFGAGARGGPGYGRRLFPPSFRTSPFAPLHPANFGARRGPGVRFGASAGVGLNNGRARAAVGFGRRGSRGRPARGGFGHARPGGPRR